jgi:hypothetical protein
MKLLIISLALVGAASAVLAFFEPLSLDDRVVRSDLIAKVFVRSVTRIITENPNEGAYSEGNYLGPVSIAAVEIQEVWKLPLTESLFGPDQGAKRALPRTIMVPCDYTCDESPSSLQAGQHYVVFLKALGANVYHPVDPASTHRIKDQLVSTFGIDAEPRAASGDEMVEVGEFRKSVVALVPPARQMK